MRVPFCPPDGGPAGSPARQGFREQAVFCVCPPQEQRGEGPVSAASGRKTARQGHWPMTARPVKGGAATAALRAALPVPCIPHAPLLPPEACCFNGLIEARPAEKRRGCFRRRLARTHCSADRRLRCLPAICHCFSKARRTVCLPPARRSAGEEALKTPFFFAERRKTGLLAVPFFLPMCYDIE